MMKPRSIAMLMAHPPIIATMRYIERLRNRRPDARGLVLAMALEYPTLSYEGC